MENMNGFRPTWQLKPWVVALLFASVIAVLCSSCATTRHHEPARVSVDYSQETAALLHQRYDDKRICREEPWPSRVR